MILRIDPERRIGRIAAGILVGERALQLDDTRGRREKGGFFPSCLNGACMENGNGETDRLGEILCWCLIQGCDGEDTRTKGGGDAGLNETMDTVGVGTGMSDLMA